MRRRAVLAVPLLAACAACGGRKPPLPTNVGVAALAAPTPLPSAALAPARDPSPPGVEAHLLLSVPEGSIGPFLARRGDVVMGAYVGTSSEGARRVVSIPLSASGEPRGDARVVAPLTSDATLLVARPTGGTKPGFVAAWTSLTDRGEALTVVGILDDGRPRAQPTELARTSDDIVWVDVLPTPHGAIVFWAEQTHSEGASLLAAALGPDGALHGLPARVARGVTGWQTTATPDGAALVLVAALGARASGPDAANAGSANAKKGSVVTWQRFDADARPQGAPVTVASGAHVSGDVDAVRAGDQTLLAWTDSSKPDPQPVLAAVDAAGHVRGPKRAIEGGAGGTLVGLAAGPAGAALAWEEPFRRGRSSKRIDLARVDVGALVADARTAVPLDVQGRGAPEIVGLAEGFALLAPTRACTRTQACGDAPVLPTFVRFDAKLEVVQVEPLRLGVLREAVSAGWGLVCGSGPSCLVLGAVPSADGTAPRILAADLGFRATPFRSPVAAVASAGAPTVEALDTVASGQPFADLSVARVGDGTIAALLASANDETAKRDDVAAISTRAFAASGAASGEGIVAKRALAIGGVAIASSDRPEDGAAIAWVGRDAGDPQVHVSRVDPHGKLLHDVQLSNARGDASDVAIAWTGDQWIVGWVDTRDGNGEVYAATIDRTGRAVGRGQRITNAPGDASDVALLTLPPRAPGEPPVIWISWADPRESPQDGFADIYVAQLRARDASRDGDEVRVLATAAHSRSPALAARGKDVFLGWIEEAPMGAEPAHALAYGAMLARLAPTGHPATEPTRLPGAGDGFPTAIALDASTGALHALLARAAGDLIGIDAIDLPDGKPAAPFALVTLDGPPSLDVALGVTADAVFFNDESAEGDARRVRRATVRWRR